MNSGTLWTLTFLSMIVASASATAVQTLHEFWRHQLEEYCRKRGKLEWFTTIIERRQELALGATTLQMISIAMAVICGIMLFFLSRQIDTVTPFSLLGLVGLWSLLLLLANCWIPWGVRMIAAPSFLYRTWRVWWAVALCLAPLTAGVEVASTLFRRALGKKAESENDEEAFEDEILSMVSEGEHDGLLEHDAREMIEGVFDLDDSVVAKVMTPRSRVDVIDVNATWEEFSQLVTDTRRTRLPVVQGQFKNPEDVVGILFVKDLLPQFLLPSNQRLGLKELVRQTMLVPGTKHLDDMLQQFLEKRSHMAVVIDEYGAVAGVITIEDILEEIVGEIIDEKDSEEPGEIVKVSDRIMDVDGTVRIDQLNDEFGLGLPEDQDFDTLSGLIMNSLKTVPKRGQKLQFEDVEFDVRQANRRFVERVRLTILNRNETNNGDSHDA